MELFSIRIQRTFQLVSTLFCCYTGLRFSDFKQLSNRNLIIIDGNSWLILNSLKTGSKLQIPLYLLFRGKALNIISHYNSIEELSKIGCNSDTNRILQKLVQMAGINKKITYHVARHSRFSFLLKFKHLQTFAA